MSSAPSDVSVAFTADPVTHLLSSWRYGETPRFVCGQFAYELRRELAGFRCVPIVQLRDEPWASSRVERLQNGIWMLHAENPLEGVGFFLNRRDADYSESQMRVSKTISCVGSADLRFLKFLDPLWPTIDQMESAFWDHPLLDWETQFRTSIELMRRFKGARELFAVIRLRVNHPYC